MPVDSLRCVNCITMEYNIDEGYKPSEFDDYDFAEDAFDFEVSFKYHLKLSPVMDVEMIILFLTMPQVKKVPTERYHEDPVLLLSFVFPIDIKQGLC